MRNIASNCLSKERNVAARKSEDQYDTKPDYQQIQDDLRGVIRLGQLQAELLKSVQSQLEALARQSVERGANLPPRKPS